jgi:GTP cyclohydrolase IB
VIPDVQAQTDTRGIEIDAVGITGLRYPVTFDDGTTVSSTVATFEIGVRLPHDRRGTHMSRMVQLVDAELRVLDPTALPRVLKSAADRLDVHGVQLTASLAIATEVRAPVTGLTSWQTHDLRLVGRADSESLRIETEVTSDVTSLCPCSKEVSDYGAHNQRSQVTLTIIGTADDPYPVPVHMIVQMIRAVGSSPVFPLVKRPDERAVTMTAFDEPAFVEDMARDLSEACRSRGLGHRVAVRNLESIHSHDAFAVVMGSAAEV